MEKPLYKSFCQHLDHPLRIIVTLNDNRRLEIKEAPVVGGANAYRSILQAFNNKQTEICNALIKGMLKNLVPSVIFNNNLSNLKKLL
jgi:hypothetical protein